MAKFWSKVKEICYSDESRHQSERKSPRMANLALEVLANREEAQDEVYYDALKRINAKNKVSLKLSFLETQCSTAV